MRAFIAATVVVLCSAGNSYAQTDCGTVLTKGLREYDIQSDSSEYLNSTFDNYCSASGETKNSSVNVGLDAVVKAIPVKFTLGTANASTAMANFCKTYKSDTSSTSISNRYRETIVQRAYQSFDSCVSLSSAGNQVTHDILSLQKVQLFLRAGIDKPVELRGIDASSNISCSGANKGKLINYTQNTPTKTENSLTINCTRKGTKAADGSMVYDEGSIALDIALGKYSVFWPRDTRISENQASLITTTIAELRNRLNSAEKRRFICDRVENTSGVYRGATISADIPEAQRAGSILTGGGCDIPGFYGHNPPITVSRPTPVGWTCTASDPPNIPLPLAVRAHAIFCRVAE